VGDPVGLDRGERLGGVGLEPGADRGVVQPGPLRRQRTSRGISLVAVNRGGADQPGVYVVIAADPAEMRDALSP
jgi:hypothetical protein